MRAASSGAAGKAQLGDLNGRYKNASLKEYLSGTMGDIVTGKAESHSLASIFNESRMNEYEELRSRFIDKDDVRLAPGPGGGGAPLH